MRVLVISDIHSNSTALQAVLEQTGPVDQTWCLGDLVGYGPDPNGVLQQLRELENLTCVLGNHDAAVLGQVTMDDFNSDARRSLTWTQKVLTAENLDYLRTLPYEITVPKEVSLVHGSPRDPIWEYILNPHQARLNFDFFDTPFCFVGHSHLQSMFTLHGDDKRVTMENKYPGEAITLNLRTIANPGSVGQPRDGDPRAAFAIYNNEVHSWEARRAGYNIASVAQCIREAGLPENHAIRLAEGW